MASSKSASTRKAQIPSLCHLCEDSPNIQWKCVDCDLLMCSKCKTKVHSKFKAADDHDVINLKNMSFNKLTKTEIDLKYFVCNIHKSQKVCLYCNTCGEMACPTCVSENHNKHQFEDVYKVYDDRVYKLKYIRDEMTADLQILVDEGNAIGNEKLKRDNLDNITEKDILRQEKEFIKVVHSEAAKLVQKLKSSNIQQENLMSFAKANNLRNLEDIKSKISTVEAVLNGNNIDTITNANKCLIPSLVNRTRPDRDKRIHHLKFRPGKIDKIQVSRILGLLQHTNDDSEVKMDILLSDKTDCNIITNLYSCKNGNVLLFDERDSQCMKRVQFKDNAINTVTVKENVRIFDVIENDKNDFIVSFVDNTTLKRLRPDGKFENFLDLSPLLPRALHLSKSGKLFVSVREKGGGFPLKPSSQRKLLVMKTDGKLIHEYNLDNQKKRLFSFVARMSSGISNDIYLVDWTSYESEGSVAALRYPNQIVWRYSGHVNTKFPFCPCGIVTTELGNIVVTDRDNSFCHILNCDGTLKRFLNLDNHGITFPLSLAIDATGLLWIGCTNLKGTFTYDATLHVVKCSGF